MYIRSLYICILIIFVFLTCKNPFAPSLAGDDTPHSRLLTLQKTPEEVLSNFQYAYTFKDSLVYSETLDSIFIFKSTNFNESPPQPIIWGRDVELRKTGQMFRWFKTLDVVWNTLSPPDTVSFGGTSTGLIIEHNITFTLTLDGGRDIPPLNGEVVFQFIQRDNIYMISFWEDLII
jgi:hypothetical protein